MFGRRSGRSARRSVPREQSRRGRSRLASRTRAERPARSPWGATASRSRTEYRPSHPPSTSLASSRLAELAVAVCGASTSACSALDHRCIQPPVLNQKSLSWSTSISPRSRGSSSARRGGADHARRSSARRPRLSRCDRLTGVARGETTRVLLEDPAEADSSCRRRSRRRVACRSPVSGAVPRRCRCAVCIPVGSRREAFSAPAYLGHRSVVPPLAYLSWWRATRAAASSSRFLRRLGPSSDVVPLDVG